VQAANGDLYGTTLIGGVDKAICNGGCGTLFKISPGGTLTTLYQFCSKSGCTDGADPYAGLILASDGDLYGTTQYGGAQCKGASGCGTIFRITPGGALTTEFSFDDTNGRRPVAGLIQATNGKFYGTTDLGGTNQEGTVFEFTPGGPLTELYNFGVGGAGVSPFASLVQATSGNLYGTTPYGGTDEYGTIFGISGIPPNAVPK
jgi:uncharacterized repeat protein (TIGR03803 family)